MIAKQVAFRFSQKELEEARQRNRLRKRRGSKEEYIEHMLEEYAVFKLLSVVPISC